MSFSLKPLTLAAANAFIKEHHRHHGAAQGYKFAIGLVCGEDSGTGNDLGSGRNSGRGVAWDSCSDSSVADNDVGYATDSGGELRGVAVVGRPVARPLDDGYTAEVTRLCTDGVKNGCSFLYAAAARTARGMGYRQIVTYTLESESGASLRAVGWTFGGIKGGGNWDRPNTRRRRADDHPTGKKRFYYKAL